MRRLPIKKRIRNFGHILFKLEGDATLWICRTIPSSDTTSDTFRKPKPLQFSSLGQIILQLRYLSKIDIRQDPSVA